VVLRSQVSRANSTITRDLNYQAERVAVFPTLADVVEVKRGSRTAAHWSNDFIWQNRWLLLLHGATGCYRLPLLQAATGCAMLLLLQAVTGCLTLLLLQGATRSYTLILIYSRFRKNLARKLSHHSYKLAFTGSQRPICNSRRARFLRERL